MDFLLVYTALGMHSVRAESNCIVLPSFGILEKLLVSEEEKL